MKWFWNLLEWWKMYRLQRLEMQLAAQTAPIKAMQEMVATMAQSSQASTKVLETWLSAFTAPVATTTTTMRDSDEIRLELERLGFERPELHETLDNAIKSGQIGEFRNILGDIS